MELSCKCPGRGKTQRACGASRGRGRCLCHCHARGKQERPPVDTSSGWGSRDCIQPDCGAKVGEYCSTPLGVAHAIRLKENPTAYDIERTGSYVRGRRRGNSLRQRRAA